MNILGVTWTATLSFFFVTTAAAADIEVVVDRSTLGPGKFAADEIRREATANGAALAVVPNGIRVVLTVETAAVAAQSYSIRVQSEGGRRDIIVRGADPTGAMYGGLDIAEAIRTGTIDSLKDSNHKPHIAQRGIKFNIPLDLRTPSYSDNSTSAQANIPEMWSLDFWHELIDRMARDRYNVLTLWNLHPFPSIRVILSWFTFYGSRGWGEYMSEYTRLT